MAFSPSSLKNGLSTVLTVIQLYSVIRRNTELGSHLLSCGEEGRKLGEGRHDKGVPSHMKWNVGTGLRTPSDVHMCTWHTYMQHSYTGVCTYVQPMYIHTTHTHNEEIYSELNWYNSEKKTS